jgi:polygalacturonase
MLNLGTTFMKRGVAFILASLAFAGWVHAQAVNPTLPTIPAGTFNVTNYGAVGDGKTTNTTAIANAIAAAVAAGGGTVEFPAATNTYLSGPITLSSSIRLQVDTGAELQMLPYGAFPTSVTNSDGNVYTFIFCKNVHDLEISGGGTIDGQGAGWWSVLATNGGSLPAPYNGQSNPPLLLDLFSCDRLFIHDITFQNAPYHHCGIRDNGGNITISNLTVSAASTSPNTDGIDFVGTNSLIENCHISDGDDNIALGSTGPLIGLVITNCAFGSGHGVSVGSTVTDGITNVTVINCSFNGTVNGIRMKCDPDASSLVTNLNYLNISMTNVQLPIVIYTYYNFTGTPDDITTADVLEQTAEPVNSTTPKWSGITISNLNIISGGSSDIGGIIWGPVEWPISNLTLVCITNNAPKTFDLYNVYGVQIINSQFNFSSGNTFTLCNAGVTISNTVPGGSVDTITGASSTNSLALYNVSASMSSTNLFAANPITISGGVLTNTNNLTLPASTTQNFFLGSNTSTIAVTGTGNLTLNSTINITNAGGFTNTNYTLFTYTGSLSGQPVLGSTPTGFAGYTYSLSTNTAGEVLLVVSAPQTTPTLITAPTASPITYGQALSASTLSGGEASVPGSFAFTTPTTTPGAGTNNQSVTFTPANTNQYTTLVFNVSVTVNQATPTLTTAPTASAIYDGQALSASTLSGGEASVPGSFAFTTPTATPGVGTANQSVTCTPTDNTDYSTISFNVSVTVNPFTITTLTTSSTSPWTVPPGVTSVQVQLWGGGGGGGGQLFTSSGSGGAGGGGGGGYTTATITVTPGNTISFTVGAGGTGGEGKNPGPSNGGNGGNSTFGSVTAANGGTGGGEATVPGSGGIAGPGGLGGTYNSGSGAAGSGNHSGGGGGSAGTATNGNSASGTTGGAAVTGGGAGGNGLTAKGGGAAGSVPGGGGSGGMEISGDGGNSGGAGGAGQIIITNMTGQAVALQVVLPGQTVVGGVVSGTPTGQVVGVQFSVTINAVDAYGNVITSATPTVNFTSTDGAASLPGATTLVSGTATVNVTLNTAGSQTVTASDQADILSPNTSSSVTVGTVVPQPVITSISISGANLTINGNNGVAGTYTLLTSTDPTLPFSSWTSAGTFTLSASGSFSKTVNGAVTVSDSEQFYVLQAP